MRGLPIRLARLLLALAPMIAGAQTDPSPWRFVDPGAKAVISVDWKRISHSSVGSMIRQRWIEPSDGAKIPGIQFLENVDRFLIASPGSNAADEVQEAPLLVVATGHFELAKIRAFLLNRGTKPQQFNSFVVYRPQGKSAKDLAFVLFDAQTILIGDSRSIFASLERNAFQRPAPDPNSIFARAAEMEANYDAWALVTAPGALATNRLTDLLTGAGLDTEPKGFEAGISLRNGLAADITVSLSSEEDAKSAAPQFAKIVHLAAKDKAGEPFLQDFERRMKFTSEGARVKITLRLTPQELEKNGQLFAASPKRRPAPDLQSIQTPTPAAPPEKQVIRIEGLDGGTREIPLQHP